MSVGSAENTTSLLGCIVFLISLWFGLAVGHAAEFRIGVQNVLKFSKGFTPPGDVCLTKAGVRQVGCSW